MKDLTEDWKTAKLSDIANISAGGTPRRNIQEYWKNGDIPWLKISDLKETYIKKSKEYITKSGLDNSSQAVPKLIHIIQFNHFLSQLGNY